MIFELTVFQSKIRRQQFQDRRGITSFTNRAKKYKEEIFLLIFIFSIERTEIIYKKQCELGKKGISPI